MLESVDSSWSPWDDWATRLLNSGDTGQSPEITVGDPWELLLDLLHVVSCDVLVESMSRCSERPRANDDFAQPCTHQTVVSAVCRLWLESHSGVVGSTGVVLFVVGTRSVPSQSDQNWGEGSV